MPYLSTLAGYKACDSLAVGPFWLCAVFGEWPAITRDPSLEAFVVHRGRGGYVSRSTDMIQREDSPKGVESLRAWDGSGGQGRLQ